jgi:hypothetical protein
MMPVKIAVYHISGYNPLTQRPYWHEGPYYDCEECRRADVFFTEQYGLPSSARLQALRAKRLER